jgi:hypothetical protein
MREAVKIGFVIACLSMLFLGCDKDKSYPETPELEFLRIEDIGADSVAIVMGFQDGNGDIGSGVDSASCIVKDFQYRYYELVEGEWVYVALPLEGYCVESLTPESQDKTLEGEIISRFPRTIEIGPDSDSIRFGFRLQDRAENISNEVFSPLIVND